MPYRDSRGCLKSLSASPEPLKHKASGVMKSNELPGADFCLAKDRSRRTSKAERYSNGLESICPSTQIKAQSSATCRL